MDALMVRAYLHPRVDGSAAPEAGTAKPIEILLVDDEPRNLDALEAVLDDPEYHLFRALDHDAALMLLLEHDVAAIVLDIRMPGVTGLELAELIKRTKRYREIPILFLTAHFVTEQDVIAGYGAGAVDYLMKPVNPLILKQKVAIFVELYRKTKALAELNATLEDRVKARTEELARSQEALREANQHKDDFIATLAHELRNPLVPLRTGVEILRATHKDAPPPVMRMIGTMERQLTHVVRLVDDLLETSRLSRGMLDLREERVELGEIVRNAAEDARPFLDRRRHTLTVHTPEPVQVNADPARVAQILRNLLHNAAKFTPEGGRIRIELECDGASAHVRVTDSGMGIDPDQLDHVFGLFTRVHPENTRTEAGLGIGLALGRRLAEMQRGALTAASDGIGRGSTFTLTLPAEEVIVTAVRPVAAARSSAQRALRLLLIEDNSDVSATLAELLCVLGHRVVVAATGAEGVALATEQRFDLILCDLGLPDFDGAEACRQIREKSGENRPPIVALTGWARTEDRERTEAAGFDAHLIKPATADALRGVFDRVQP
jgi:signal transduction histidine kinase